MRNWAKKRKRNQIKRGKVEREEAETKEGENEENEEEDQIITETSVTFLRQKTINHLVPGEPSEVMN